MTEQPVPSERAEADLVETLAADIRMMCEDYRDTFSIILGRAHKGLVAGEIERLRAMCTALLDSFEEVVNAITRGEIVIPVVGEDESAGGADPD